jgi:phage shock protein C
VSAESPGVPPSQERPPEQPQRVLRRSSDDRIIGGVCGGLARYLGVDAVAVRLGFVVLTIAGGGGILLYLVAWLLIPEQKPGEDIGPPAHARIEGIWLYVGVGLIALGSILLVDQLFPWFDRVIGPIVLVAIGVGILVGATRHGRTR